MDFGNILDQWDARQKGAQKQKAQNAPNVSHKKANADWIERQAGAAPAEHKIQDAEHFGNQMKQWLDRHGTVDKDKLCKEASERRAYTSVRALENMREDAAIDLHGLTQDEAEKRLRAFIADCCAKKFKKILIIHGKGIHTGGNDEPVLRALVKRFLEHDKRLGRSGHPATRDGGNGATWVMLKNHEPES